LLATVTAFDRLWLAGCEQGGCREQNQEEKKADDGERSRLHAISVELDLVYDRTVFDERSDAGCFVRSELHSAEPKKDDNHSGPRFIHGGSAQPVGN
jgi:hypothetical protein